jgi:hypothetical protein
VRATLSVIALCAALPARSPAAELLPQVSLHLAAAHYAPAEPDARWSSWIGAGAGVLEAGGVTVYFTADVETILGTRRRDFEATQANYHLEVGGRGALGTLTLNPFFHHVSRHLVDQDKPEAVDWNVLGLRVRLPIGTRLLLEGSLGHTTLASLVGYGWEATAAVDASLGHRVYALGRGRFVTVDPSPQLPREDFLDLAFELGARWRREDRALETFAALERRHDVFPLTPSRRDRLLAGFRIRYQTQR